MAQLLLLWVTLRMSEGGVQETIAITGETAPGY